MPKGLETLHQSKGRWIWPGIFLWPLLWAYLGNRSSGIQWSQSLTKPRSSIPNILVSIFPRSTQRFPVSKVIWTYSVQYGNLKSPLHRHVLWHTCLWIMQSLICQHMTGALLQSSFRSIMLFSFSAALPSFAKAWPLQQSERCLQCNWDSITNHQS